MPDLSPISKFDRRKAISKHFGIPIEEVHVGERGQYSPRDGSGLLIVRTLEEDKEYCDKTRFENQQGRAATVTLDDGKVFIIRGEHVAP